MRGDGARNQGRGFTLIELLVAISVLVILATVAVPSFTTLIRNNRAASEANQVLSVLTLARSEAVRRNRHVTVCPSSDGLQCEPSASWEKGVIVFVDANAAGERDAQDPSAELLQSIRPLSRVSTISTNGFPQAAVIYTPLGRTYKNAMGRIDVQPKSGETRTARKVVISSSGRPQIQKFDEPSP